MHAREESWVDLALANFGDGERFNNFLINKHSETDESNQVAIAEVDKTIKALEERSEDCAKVARAYYILSKLYFNSVQLYKHVESLGLALEAIEESIRLQIDRLPIETLPERAQHLKKALSVLEISYRLLNDILFFNLGNTPQEAQVNRVADLICKALGNDVKQKIKPSEKKAVPIPNGNFFTKFTHLFLKNTRKETKEAVIELSKLEELVKERIFLDNNDQAAIKTANVKLYQYYQTGNDFVAQVLEKVYLSLKKPNDNKKQKESPLISHSVFLHSGKEEEEEKKPSCETCMELNV